MILPLKMRRFYAPVENFSNRKITLRAEESKHLQTVLRLRAGAEVFVFDGAGNEFFCIVESLEKNATILQIVEKVPAKSPESKLNLTLAVALLKGEKFDLIVQKACELGASRIVPLETRRADAKIKNAADTKKKLERWRRIALEAAKQSGRARLMEVDAPVSFENFIGAASGARILFAESGGENFKDFFAENYSEITAAIGAEGGWEEAEIERARAAGFQIITLGGRILRAETAAIAIPALLQNHFGDLN